MSIKVTWYKDSVKMFETDKVLMTQKSRTWSLKLTTVERKMFGNYTCVATNSLGTQQDTTTLTGQFQFFKVWSRSCWFVTLFFQLIRN